MDRRTHRTRWIAIAALGAWVLALVVGSGERADAEYWLGTRYLNDVWTWILNLLLIVSLVVMILGAGRGGPKPTGRPPKRGKIWPWLLLGIAWLWWQPDIERLTGNRRASEAEPFDGDTTAVDEVAEERVPVAELTDLLMLAVALALIAVLVVASRRWLARPEDIVAEPEATVAPDADEFVQAVDRAVAQLHLGSDPRSAVLAAYAELEQVLAAQGVDRHRSETAREHLSRAVRSLPVDAAPFERLGRLYDVARFSTTDVLDADRVAAADSLAEARDELSANA